MYIVWINHWSQFFCLLFRDFSSSTTYQFYFSITAFLSSRCQNVKMPLLSNVQHHSSSLHFRCSCNLSSSRTFLPNLMAPIIIWQVSCFQASSFLPRGQWWETLQLLLWPFFLVLCQLKILLGVPIWPVKMNGPEELWHILYKYSQGLNHKFLC